MDNPDNLPNAIPFDEDTWRQLPDFLGHLNEPVCLHVWGDESASPAEREAARLAQTLADRFSLITFRLLPRRANYAYYPVIGIMAGTTATATDHGLRIIGLPVGYQLTSLIAAIQAVAFRGQTLEPLTRIKLHRLAGHEKTIRIELLTSATDVTGSLVAKTIFGAAMVHPAIHSFLIVTDFFPEAARRYSAATLPHTVINQRWHYQGELSEAGLVEMILKTLESGLSQNHR
jgi:alkyl hydroperoxide reductase subunit AhpF